ncbi:MAG TPA: cupin domain-containing protein [Aliidongia sp.]|uniref:(R)-mandelonitrile lyase n=1 Tax=Aliidongia sp. TaxID=1914230 RepID=UPI002DDCE4BF|nr:cupin domain-containing protein [Aliidongia sp.]HEV2677750.1 cupin domain-containing protein [Aliidongia sp.]
MKLEADAHTIRRGPAEWFTGTVWMEPIGQAEAPSRLHAYRVTFEPGARTAWHTHPVGQMLHVLSGIGRVQRQGEAPIEIRPGDSVWIAPGEVHWHGAAPGHAMVHLALQEADDEGNTAAWLTHVSDADYRQAPARN